MEQLNYQAKAAYENADAQCAARVPWEVLPEGWKDYWRKVASAVIAANHKYEKK